MSAATQSDFLGAEPADTNIDTLCIDTIRTLSMDAVQKANSGHPGTPMALAPVAYTIWQDLLRYDPADPVHGRVGNRFRAERWARVDAVVFAVVLGGGCASLAKTGRRTRRR